LHFVGTPRVAVTLNREPCQIVIATRHLGDITFVQDSVPSRELPSDQFYGKAAEHNDPGCLRIDPDVVLRGWRDVPFATGSAAHHHTAANLLHDLRPLAYRQGNVRQWREGYDHQSWICRYGLDNGVSGM